MSCNDPADRIQRDWEFLLDARAPSVERIEGAGVIDRVMVSREKAPRGFRWYVTPYFRSFDRAGNPAVISVPPGDDDYHDTRRAAIAEANGLVAAARDAAEIQEEEDAR